MIGQILKGTYKLYDKVGSGGFATVYLGRNLRTNQIVAVKVLREEFAEDPGSVERFRREAQLVQRLDHPNIVRVLDFGVEAGQHFLVMDYIEGKTLAQIIAERGQLPVEQAVSYVGQVCRALEHAHQHDIVHRDIKPQNLMVMPDGAVKVMDFGVAKLAVMTALTYSGQSMGTPRYMSPEMVKGEPVDVRGDIYSLGVVLYEMLVGRVPFDAESPWTVMRQHIETPPRPLGELRRGLPQWLESAVARALAKDPAARFQTPGDMLAELRASVSRSAPAPVPAFRLPTSQPDSLTRAIDTVAQSTGKSREVPASDTPPARVPAVQHGAAPLRRWRAAAVGLVVFFALSVVIGLATRQRSLAPLLSDAGSLAVQRTATLALVTEPQETGQPEPISATAIPDTETSRARPKIVATVTLAPSPRSGGTAPISDPVTPRVPPPILGGPNDSAESGPRVAFTWETNGYELGAGQGYALLAWKEGDPTYQGRQGLDLPMLFDACLGVPATYPGADIYFPESAVYSGSGNYLWTAVVVDLQQRDAAGHCLVISDQPASHRFTYSQSGLGPGFSDSPPTVGSASLSVPPPILGDPNDSAEPGSRVAFTWQTNGYELGEGQGYALLAWKEDDPTYQGRQGLDLPMLFDACLSVPATYPGADIDFPESAAYSGPGSYLWTAVVVDLRQQDGHCVVISDQPTPHRFTYTGERN